MHDATTTAILGVVLASLKEREERLITAVLNEIESANKKVLAEARGYFILPEDVAFDSSLEELKEQVDVELAVALRNIAQALSQKSDIDHTHDTRYSNIDHNHDERYAALVHNHDDLYVKLLDYNGAIKRFYDEIAAQKEYVATLEKNSSASTKKVIEQLTTSIEAAKKIAQDSLKTVSDSVEAAEASVSDRFSGINKTIRDLRSTIKDAEKSASALIESVEKRLATKNIELDGDIEQLRIETKKALEGKSNVGHNHDDRYSKLSHNHDDRYSKLDHTHPDLAKKDDVAAKVKDLYKEIETKPSKADLKKVGDNLPALVEAAKKEIISSLPEPPKDGKDGLQWEFKFHPTKRGVLLYKREDQDSWQQYNLLVVQKEFIQEDEHKPLGGGGFVIGTPENSGSGINVFTSSGQLSYAKQWIGMGLTNSEGKIIVDLSSAAFTSIISYSLTPSLDNLTELIDGEERAVTINPLIVVPSSLTAQAFVQKKIVSKAGVSDFAFVNAPAGIQVAVSIYGT